MQTPDTIRPADQSDHSGVKAKSPPDGAGAAPASDPPTVVRTSSSLARRLQAGQIAATNAPQVILPRPGEVVDTFVLEEAIGIGGMGAVFRALDAQLDRQVALKLLPLDQTDDPEIVQRFYQEGRSAAQLDHENIARVYSIGQDGPYYYIAFEYIEGLTVRRRVDEHGPLPVNEAVDIALQIAQALVHAAERGVVHRDIKPSNIILTPQGRAKLVDMGLARRFERESDHGLTQSGMTLGTFDYISPEQARDPREVDARSDLYSLGCTMFHMLTGRPPFPGGTVLQKLLQHQEEPPPEIRGLNPAVPVELAKVITRLLAKDPDRRHQSPEQLVRDLLVIAGQIGMPIIPADQHLWMTSSHRVTWERHLVWFFPALAFCLVVAGLLWWGREGTDPVASGPGAGAGSPVRYESGGQGRSAAFAAPPAAAANPSEREEPTPPLSLQPRNIAVRPGEDLLNIIATAPPRSVITLTDDGPYLVGGRTGGFRGTGTLAGRDLTLKAESGFRPVIRFAADATLGDRTSAALLPFSGGNVAIEGLTFELDSDGPEAQAAAISTEDSALSIRGCMFRHGTLSTGRSRTAIRIRPPRTTPTAGDRPPRTFVDACHFDGGQIGILAEGPVDLLLRDCTLGPCAPAIWIDNSRGSGGVPAEIRLWHTSFMAGSGPVIEIEGTLARVQADDCVVSPAGPAQATLAAVDSVRNLTWQGRNNLYFRIRAYLEPTRKEEGARSINDFSEWRETAAEVREVDTLVASTPVWNSVQPLQELIIEQENPTQAFGLAPVYLATSSFGARQGPYGARLIDLALIASRSPRGPLSSPGADRPGGPARTTMRSASAEAPARNPGSETSSTGASGGVAAGGGRPARPSTPDGELEDEAANFTAMPPMTTAPGVESERPGAGDTRYQADPGGASKRIGDDPTRRGAALTEPRPTNGSGSRIDSDEDAIRSAEQFISTINRFGAKGGTLKLAREADLDLPATEFIGPGPWVIEAEPGARRPRIRFRPTVFPARPPSAWTTLFNLRSGSLRIHGVDLVVPGQDAEAARTGGQAAIGVAAGARLELADCTITVASRSQDSAAVVVQPGAGEADADRTDNPADAVVIISNAFLRASGDGIHVAPGRLLDLQLKNVLVGTDGSLLHALGSSRMERSVPALKVKIERALARTKGGLVYLESKPDQKELPLTTIEAGNSIFTTAGQSPLFRVDGQGQIDQLRDRISWKAEKVAYDQITTYRRDQILQTGVSPRDYTRSDWRTAFDPKDELPVLDGVKFLRKLELGRTAWSLTKDDLKLDPQSAATDRGPDLSRIPAAPPADS